MGLTVVVDTLTQLTHPFDQLSEYVDKFGVLIIIRKCST